MDKPPAARQLAHALNETNVRVERDGDGYQVVIDGIGGPSEVASLSGHDARTIKQVLAQLRDHKQRSLQETIGDRAEIVKKCKLRYPSLSEETVRHVVGKALDEFWGEAALVARLQQESYAQVLRTYQSASMWGVLVMSQRDGNVCSPCQQLDNVAYRIGRAVDEQPLPHSGCRNPTCRCQYLPVIQEDDLYGDVEKRD